MSHPTRRPRRLAIPLAATATVALAAPALAVTAPIRPTADCTLVGGKDGLVAYFGYDNPNPASVTIPVTRVGSPANYFTPMPSNRRQPSVFAPGRHSGVVAVDAFPDTPVTWTVLSPGEATPQEATASYNTKRCLPNLTIAITGPATSSVGHEGTWVVTVTHGGYPEIAPELQPDIGIPVSDIVTSLPTLGRTDLTPDSTPSGGVLKPGQSLTYTVRSPKGGIQCANGSIQQTATTGLKVGTEYRTDDNSATTATKVTGCAVDVGVGITPNPGSTTPGGTVTWNVPVTNTGNTPVRIEDISVIAPGLPNLAPAPGTPTQGLLNPGQTIGFVATTTVTAGQCGTLTNTVRVVVGTDATPAAGRDMNPANDSAIGSVVVVCGTPESTPAGTPAAPVPAATTPTTGGGTACVRPGLSTTVGGARRLVAGQVTTIALTTRNRSRATAATGTSLRYSVPADITLVRLPPRGTLRGGKLTVDLGRLAPGASRTVRVSVRVARTARRTANHRVQVTASCAAAATGRLASRITPVGGLVQPNVTG